MCMGLPKFIATASIVFAAAFGLSSCSHKFIAQAHSNQLPKEESPLHPVKVTFSGISTFLITDGDTQIVIDGYYSRAAHHLLFPIQPDITQITNAATQLGLEPFRCGDRRNIAVKSCQSTSAHRGLSWVIPLHSHYDHGMDSAIVAGMHGAGLVADNSMQNTLEASKIFLDRKSIPLQWDDISIESGLAPDDVETLSFKSGAFKITLIKTPHLKTPVHKIFKEVTAEDFKFPSTIRHMGEGTPISVLIQREGWSLLVIGSAGDVAPALRKAAIEAHVVFFGIGGLGLKGKKTRADRLNSVLELTKAQRVIPIHWDGHGQQLFDKVPVPSDLQLKPFAVDRLDATLRTLQNLKASRPVKVSFPPLLQPFDPFQGLAK